MKGFRTAVSFLTILPVRRPETHSPEDFGKAVVWFPVVGLLIGTLLYVFNGLLGGVPAGLHSALLLAMWVILSGGLHLDGLADCLDGLLASTTVERRLEIMRDPRTGAFAVTGIAIFLLLKNAALAELSEPAVLLLAPTAGKAALLLGAVFPSARPGGLGALFREALTPGRAATAAVVPLLLAALLGLPGVLAIVFSALTALLVYVFAWKRLGGVTGDVFGAACELTELAVLFFYVVIA